MVGQLTVTERDLRRMLDVVHQGRDADPEEWFPREPLHALARLVPAEYIAFQLCRPLDREFAGYEEVCTDTGEPPAEVAEASYAFAAKLLADQSRFMEELSRAMAPPSSDKKA